MTSTRHSEEMLLSYADKIIDLCDRKDLRAFDGFVPIIPDLYDEEYIFFTDANPVDLLCDVNVAALRLGDPEKRGPSSEAQFHRLRKISSKELRKKTGTFAVNPYIFEVAFERHPKIANAFFTQANRRFKPIEIPNYKYNPVSIKEALVSAQILLGVQFNLENQCYVYLKPDDTPIGFKYPIESLQQLKDLFSLRDIPDGYKRRTALKHWVAGHLRKKPGKPDEKVEIKSYLRGTTNFKWFGITGSIFV